METTATPIRKKALIQALIDALGVVTQACEMAGVSRNTYYQWRDKDPEFKQQVDDIQNIALDFVESKLYKLIKDENPTSIIFYLKTKGKKRGYIEKIEHDITSKNEMVNLTPDEQIKKARELMKKVQQAKNESDENE